MLARALAKPSNLLVLDEPTNDLDIETLDLLQELLADYAGTVLLGQPRPRFLDRVVSSTLISDGDGVWTEFAGGYSDMMAQRKGAADEKKRAEKAEKPNPPATTPPPLPRPRPARANSPSSRNSRWKTCRRTWKKPKPKSPNANRKWPTRICSPRTPPVFSTGRRAGEVALLDHQDGRGMAGAGDAAGGVGRVDVTRGMSA